jgi:hypothetical protein
MDAVPIDIPFPGQELIDRKIVELNYLLDWNPAAAHGLDYGRLASYRPPLSGPRQLGHLAEYIVQAGVIRRTFARGGIVKLSRRARLERSVSPASAMDLS